MSLTIADIKLVTLEFRLKADLPRYMDYFIEHTARRIQMEKMATEFWAFIIIPAMSFEEWLKRDREPKVAIVSSNLYDKCKEDLSSNRYWGFLWPGLSLHRSESLPPDTAVLVNSDALQAKQMPVIFPEKEDL
jgi:hypothetical protein